MILPKEEYPEELKNYPEVRGVFVGGCVERGDGSRFRAKAHSHTEKTDEYFGWICFLSRKRIKNKYIVLHELAHILTLQGHNDRWRKKLLELGGRLERIPGLTRDYRKKSRFHGLANGI